MKASQVRDRIEQMISEYGDCEIRLHVKRTKTITDSIPVESVAYFGEGDFHGQGVISLGGDLFERKGGPA